ncbi:glycosyltransferase [Arthrobacter crystallopoietes]|uniref:glycosyltransferase family 2 protein n=1 Tax=Micrococcaceae TaxID=1268 RepID=UPI0021C98724|nr:glycosyltransferase [Arthrobacter sp. Marseille-P9274]
MGEAAGNSRGLAGEQEAQIVIAVHTADRPIRRAVESVVAAGQGRAGALVVCHNMGPEPVRKALADLDRAAVRVLELNDGIASPAGPFNFGLRSATAEFVGIMGSDDALEPGAVAAWLDLAASTGADVAIAPLRTRSGRPILTPRARVLRGALADPLKDRLAYRTAPLGLFRRRLLEAHQLSLTEGLQTGEDLEFGLKLWYSGAPIAYRPGAPAYLVGEDAEVRVTSAVLPLKEQFRDVRHLVEGEWFAGLRPPERDAIAVKLLRGHVLSAALRRGSGFGWDGADCQELSALTSEIAAFAPGVSRALSRPDEELLEALRGTSSPTDVRRALKRREAAGPLRRSVTTRPADNLRTEAPLRSNASSLLALAHGRFRRLLAGTVR